MRDKYNIDEWKIVRAPAESDLIWKNLGKHSFFTTIKSVILYSFLFTFCVILVSPLTVRRYLPI